MPDSDGVHAVLETGPPSNADRDARGVLRQPVLILAVLLAIISLFGSAGLPAAAVKLTQLSARPFQIAFFFAAGSAVAIGVVLAAGKVAERHRDPMTVAYVCLGWLAVGNVLLAHAGSYGAMLAAGTVFSCAGTVPTAQLMTKIGKLNTGNRRAVDRTSQVRAGYAMGWVGGASLGGTVTGFWGANTVFLLAAGGQVICAAIIFAAGRHLRMAERSPSPPTPRPRRPAPAPIRPLLPFAAAFVLVSAGGQMRSSGLPVLLLGQMRASPAVTGVVLAITPLAEIPAFLCVGWAARRLDVGRVLLAGCTSAVLYFLGLAVSAAVVQVALLQVAFAFYVACAAGLAVGVAQRLQPDRISRATALMFGAENMANLCGGVLAVVALAVCSVQTAFLFPAGMGLAGVVVLIRSMRGWRVSK